MTRHGGRIIDAIVLALILLLGIQSAAQVPENLFSPGLGLPNVVGLGQILLASCGALVLCAYWRQRRWLIPAASLWGAGVVLASSAASVAWSGFSWSALVASFVAASLLGAALVYWAWRRTVARRRRESVQAEHQPDSET